MSPPAPPRQLLAVAALSFIATATACQGRIERSKYEGHAEHFIRWAPSDDPALLGRDLVYELGALPAQGQTATAPWPGSYWPTYQDSINYAWSGASTQSAAAKYGRAFGVPDVERRVSETEGILAQSARRSCSTNRQCNAQNDEVCGKRPGDFTSRCIPRWWGSCHAWAPAAILEPELSAAATFNGVTFRVNDMKALLTMAYDKTQYKYVSLRCYEVAARGEIRYDEFGRPTGDGRLHILVYGYEASTYRLTAGPQGGAFL